MDSKPHAVASERAFNEATGLHLGNPTNVRILSGSNLNNHESTRIIVERFTPPRT